MSNPIVFSGSQNYHSHWHCVYHLKYHLVLVTKYRRNCFTKTLLRRLKDICHEQCQLWGIELSEFGGERDHIHLLLDMHPNVMPSKFINSLKTVTSRLLRKEFSEHLSKFFWKPVLWSRAYCLITAGGAPIDVLTHYIQNQDMPKQWWVAIHLHPNAARSGWRIPRHSLKDIVDVRQNKILSLLRPRSKSHPPTYLHQF